MKFTRILFAIAFLCGCNSAEETTETNSSSNDTTVNASSTTPAGDNMLTDSEKYEGWQLLFDGTSKNGWHVYNNKSDGSAWKVVDGTLHLEPTEKIDFQTKGGGDIVTSDEFENFHLKLEWKLDTGGNSGVIFFVKEDPKYEHAWHTGLEMQVLDNSRHPDAKINKHKAGDLYDLISTSPEAVKPAGEWNLAEIKSNKGTLEFYLNGTKILHTVVGDDNWKKLVAGSKFKKWPDFATYKSGKIALQDHGDKVWYRNVKIQKL